MAKVYIQRIENRCKDYLRKANASSTDQLPARETMIRLILILAMISLVASKSFDIVKRSVLLCSCDAVHHLLSFRSTAMLWNVFHVRMSDWPVLLAVRIVSRYSLKRDFVCLPSALSICSCGATTDHCQGAVTQGNCQTKGCPDGLCCSKFGFCGNSASHCDNSPVTNGNCKTQGCPAGQCCSRHGLYVRIKMIAD